MNCIVCHQADLSEGRNCWALCGSQSWCLVKTELAPIEPRWLDAEMNRFGVTLMRPAASRYAASWDDDE